MASMIREWLRRLIGWDEVDSRFMDEECRVAVLIERVDENERRIQLVAYKHAIAPTRQSNLDWEAQQQEFLNNPENFKEMN